MGIRALFNEQQGIISGLEAEPNKKNTQEVE